MINSVVGKTCPYCQTPIKPNTQVAVCSACGMPHHLECWQDNGRCTTFGCNGMPAGAGGMMRPPMQAPAQAPMRTQDGSAICPTCGYAMTAFDVNCPRCANLRRPPAPPPIPQAQQQPYAQPAYQPMPPPLPMAQPPGNYGPYMPVECPIELRKWNWGAFGVTLFWAAAMEQWVWFALCFIPYANTVAAIYLGVKGNELAWKSRRWSSMEQFQATQQVWNTWGIALFIVSMVLGFIIGIILVASSDS